MRTRDALKHFGGNRAAVARALGITRGAVSLWGKVVPEGSAYKLQVLTGGVLQVDPRAYEDRKHSHEQSIGAA